MKAGAEVRYPGVTLSCTDTIAIHISADTSRKPGFLDGIKNVTFTELISMILDEYQESAVGYLESRGSTVSKWEIVSVAEGQKLMRS